MLNKLLIYRSFWRVLSFLVLMTVSFSLKARPADTLNVGKGQAFEHIRLAVEAAGDGDLILISPGTYLENGLLITKKISLIGVNYPVIDGENKGEIFTVYADSVTISGLDIRNVGVNYLKEESGMTIDGCKGCVVENNKVRNTFFGIHFKKSKGCIVRNNEITGQAEEEVNSGNAIHMWSCKNMLIENNIATNHRDGIYLEFVDSSRVAGNISKGNLRYGLHFMFSNVDHYENNEFIDNGAGVAVMFSKKIVMKNNRFHKNWGTASYGLLLKEIYDSEITGNTFSENTIAIHGEGATRVEIKGNDFIQNGWALKILGSCMENVVSHNNFMGNTFDLATNSKRNYNEYAYNYWSEYTGYDLDKDGIGDVPYQPVKLFSYLVGQIPESITLLRSLFIDILNFAEKVAPVMTPENLVDETPLMKPISRE